MSGLIDTIFGEIHDGIISSEAGQKDSRTISEPQLPPYLQQLVGQTADRMGGFQNALWQQMMPGNNAGGGDRDYSYDYGGDSMWTPGGEDGPRRYDYNDRWTGEKPWDNPGDQEPGNIDDIPDDRVVDPGVFDGTDGDQIFDPPPDDPGATGGGTGGGTGGTGGGTGGGSGGGYGGDGPPPEDIPGGGKALSMLRDLGMSDQDIQMLGFDPSGASPLMDAQNIAAPINMGENVANASTAASPFDLSNWLQLDQWQGSPEGILGDNQRQIAGSNQLLDDAISRIYGLSSAPGQYGQAQDILQNMTDFADQSRSHWSNNYEASGQTLQDMRNVADAARGHWSHNYDRAGGILDEIGKAGQQQVSGDGMWDDAAVQNQMKVFEQAMLPMIENQAALSGLGRSTAMTNASAAQQAQTLMPMTQDYLARQERGIDRNIDTLGQQYAGFMGLGDTEMSRHQSDTDRLLAALGQQAQGQMGLGDAEMNIWQSGVDRYLGTMGNQVQGLTGLGDREYGRRTDQIGQLAGMGDYARSANQEQLDSGYNDWLRRAGMFENSLSGPSGLFGSTIGGNTTATKKA